MNIHENIRMNRTKMGWTLEELGKMISVSKQTINRYETGEIKNIPYDKIELLATLFGITKGEMMGWEEVPDVTEVSDHVKLITLYNKLTDEQKKSIISLMESMIN